MVKYQRVNKNLVDGNTKTIDKVFRRESMTKIQ
jgi:hypothetical protein